MTSKGTIIRVKNEPCVMTSTHWQEAHGRKVYLSEALQIDSPVVNTPWSHIQRQIAPRTSPKGLLMMTLRTRKSGLKKNRHKQNLDTITLTHCRKDRCKVFFICIFISQYCGRLPDIWFSISSAAGEYSISLLHPNKGLTAGVLARVSPTFF
jgi:hypothetical protein